MTISAFTDPELELYRRQCNFTAEELLLFELRASGKTLEQCCDGMNMEISGIKRISRKINSKICFVNDTVDRKKWIERYIQYN